jgi:hypothetical protein
MACARKAAHNILYMTVDSRASFLKYKDANPNDIYSASGKIGFKDEVFAWWKPVLYGVDALVGVLFVVWFVALFKPRSEAAIAKEEAKKADETERMKVAGDKLQAMEAERQAEEKARKQQKKSKK